MSKTGRSTLFLKMRKLLNDTLLTKKQLKEIATNEREYIPFESYDGYINSIIEGVAVDQEDIHICSEYLRQRYMSIVALDAVDSVNLFVDVVMVIKAVGESSIEKVNDVLENEIMEKGPNSIRLESIKVNENKGNQVEFFVAFLNHQLLCSIEQDLILSNSISPSCFDKEELVITSKFFFLNEIKNGNVDCEGLVQRVVESIEISKIVNLGKGVIYMSGFPFGLTAIKDSDSEGKALDHAIHSTFFRLLSGHAFADYCVTLQIEL